MGMSTSVIGLRDLDGQFAKMAAIKKLCDDSKVSYPKEVAEYFGGESRAKEPISYLQESMEEIMLKPCSNRPAPWYEEYRSNGSEGCIIDVSKLPPEVKRIKFYNWW